MIMTMESVKKGKRTQQGPGLGTGGDGENDGHHKMQGLVRRTADCIIGHDL